MEATEFCLLESSGYNTGTTNMIRKATSTETSFLLKKIDNSSTEQKLLQHTLWITANCLNLGSALVITGQILLAPIYSSVYGEGLGVLIMTLITGSAILGSIASNLTLNKLGNKNTLILTGLFYVAGIMGNFNPIWQIMVPCGLVAGFFMSIFVMTVRSYLTRIAQIYSSELKMDSDRIHSRMFVNHVLFIKAIAIFGNLGSSLILGAEQIGTMANEIESIELVAFMNVSKYFQATDFFPDICGVDYCNQPLGSINKPTSFRDGSATFNVANSKQFFVIVLLCILAGFAGLFIIALFVNQLKPSTGEKETTSTKSTIKLLLATFVQLKNPKLLLLLPLAISQPCGDAFWVADFNKAFVTCASGLHYVGYVAMWSGISGALSCFIFGWFNKTTLRSLPFTVATLAHISVLLYLFQWKPDQDSLTEMSAATAVWFLGSGVKLSLVPALFGVVFSDNIEVAYSNLNLWTYLSTMMVFGLSHFLCMDVKIYILFGILVTSYVGYVIVEIILHFQYNVTGSASAYEIGRLSNVKTNL